MNKEQYLFKKGYRITEQGVVLNPKGNEVTGYVNSHGYRSFGFRDKTGNSKRCDFHRLQAFQKYGEVIFVTGVQVRHKNNDKFDNTFENILIGTNHQNQMDIPEHIRHSRALHAASFIRKYNREEVKKFYHDSGRSYKKTMEAFDISSKGTLHFILNK